MKQKIKSIKKLELSLSYMKACMRSYERYGINGSKFDLLYATFHQLMALSYETEAIELGLESEEMSQFLCKFYGKT